MSASSQRVRILSPEVAEEHIGKTLHWEVMNMNSDKFVDKHSGVLQEVQGSTICVDGRWMDMTFVWGLHAEVTPQQSVGMQPS